MKSEFEKRAAQAAVDAVERRWEHNQRVAQKIRRRKRFANLMALVVLVSGGVALWAYFTEREIPRLESFSKFFRRDDSEVIDPAIQRSYTTALERLLSGSVKYASQMPAAVRPKNAKPGTKYDVLTGGRAGPVGLYELLRDAEGKLVISRLVSDRPPQRVTGADFRAACGGRPYLVAVDGAVYLYGSKDLSDVARLRSLVRAPIAR